MPDTAKPAALLEPDELKPAAELAGRLLEHLDAMLFGRPELHRLVVIGILSRGHVLLEGVPGVGKTALVKALSQILNLDFKRVQFTPDLMPGDILGSHILQEVSGSDREMVFRAGPIFTHLLLADEINRASPKTQSALLEAMQERSVTLLGATRELPNPFFVLATQNPIELEGTYPLPEAQLDRFLMRVAVGYPDHDDEVEILARRRQRRDDAIAVSAVTSRTELLAMQTAMEDVHVAAVVERYIVDLVRATRSDHRLALGASPRGALALLKLARGLASLRRREFVLPDDVKAMAVPALAHRLILKPELWASQVSAAHIVRDVLTAVPAPGPDAR